MRNLRKLFVGRRTFDVSVSRRFRVRIVTGILIFVTIGGSFYGFSRITKADAINTTDFVTTWKTDNTGVSNSTSIAIPTDWGRLYDYSVDWNNDGIVDETNITGDITHDFGTPGTYTIRISGTFPAIYFQGSGDVGKILAVNQWGTIHWETMQRAFQGASDLTVPANDAPDLSGVTDTSWMFYGASSMNQSVASWNMSNVTNASNMFAGATAFNQPLNSWETSNMTDISYMLSGATSFNQPLDNWDTSNVRDMSWLFGSIYPSAFNQPVNNWNTSNVTNMSGIFAGLIDFNQSLSSWDTHNVTDMYWMFRGAESFNQPLDNWDTSSVTNMNSMFCDAPRFNQPLNSWNTGNVTDMGDMFDGPSQQSSFNQSLDNWDTSNVVGMSGMFRNGVFNQPLNSWDTHNVVYMGSMFQGALDFDQPLDNWDTSNVTYMNYMFQSASSFDQPIGNWNTSSVTNMSYMFQSASSFNQQLNNWNTSNVKNMSHMFEYSYAFNQPLSNWNTGNVSNMSYMFARYGWEATGFNQSLSSWDTSKVTDMSYMFYKSTYFNQSLASWNMTSVTNMGSMLTSSGLSTANYDATLFAWSAQNLKASVSLGATGLKYCTAQTARQSIITNHTWTITGDNLVCVPPSAPRNLIVTSSQGIVVLNWQAPLSTGGGSITGYTVQYKLSSSATWTSQTTSQLTYDVTGLNPGVSYDFRILAESTHGASSSSNVAAITLTDPVTQTFDTSTLGSTQADVVGKAVLSVTSATCYQIDTPSLSVLGPNGISAPETNVRILGGLAYNLTCTSSGGSTMASITLGTHFDDVSKLRVYKKTGSSNLVDITSLVAITNRLDGSNTVTAFDYTLIDGGAFDEDGVANGTIVDPVYVGVLTTDVSATGPTLAETGQNIGVVLTVSIAAILSSFWVLYRKLA